jgi:hypothetical protein
MYAMGQIQSIAYWNLMGVLLVEGGPVDTKKRAAGILRDNSWMDRVKAGLRKGKYEKQTC